MRKLVPYRLVPLLILTGIYTLFFNKLFTSDLFLWGKDIEEYFFPIRYFFYEKLSVNVYPFWTERVLSGFPLFSDPESGMLNPINIILIKVFGPFLSYKILHLCIYLCGSLSLFYFLKQKGFSKLGGYTSCLVYFFNFFALYHQQHISLILNYYLFPTYVFLLDRFIKTPSLKNKLIFALVLAFGTYFGGLQMVAMSLMTLVCYFLIFSEVGPIIRVRTLASLLILYSILVFPFFYTVLSIHKDTERANIDFKEGSLLPPMLFNLVFPFPFEGADGYLGNRIDEGYNVQEVSLYLGVITVFFGMLAFVSITDKKLFKFTRLLVLLFFLLGFLEYLPGSSLLAYTPVSMFRYWLRSVFFLIIAVTILVGWLLSNPNFKIIWKRFYFFGGFILFFVSLTIFNIQNKHMERFFRYLAREGTFVESLKYLALGFFACLIWFYLTKRWKLRLASLLLAAFIFFDFFYNGTRALSNSFDKVSIKDQFRVTNEYENQRILFISKDMTGNERLYFKAWSPLGYSPVVSSWYAKYTKDNNIEGLKKVSDYPLEYQKLGESLGVEYVIKGSKIEQLNGGVVRENESVKILQAEEGKFKFETTFTTESELNTLVRNYPGWVITIDGDKTSSDKNTPFLTVSVPSGTHTVEFSYQPYFTFIAILISLVLLIIYLFVQKNWLTNLYRF